MPKFLVTLSRTRLQSATVAVNADNASKAELKIAGELVRHHTNDALTPYEDSLDWSDGETEGEIDLDVELVTALDVPCPKCKAIPGFPCTEGLRKSSVSPHPSRVKKAGA